MPHRYGFGPGKVKECASQPKSGMHAGFSLIELMVVVAIIAIIAAIAYPSYISSVVKTKRAAAEGCLSQYANYMERFYTANLRYDQNTNGQANPVLPPATVTLDCATNANSGNDYTFSVAVTSPTAAPPNTYTVTATPIGAQATRDTQCGVLTLNQLGTRTDATGVPGGSTDCW